MCPSIPVWEVRYTFIWFQPAGTNRTYSTPTKKPYLNTQCKTSWTIHLNQSHLTKALNIVRSKMEYDEFKFIQLKTILQNCDRRNLNVRDGRWGKCISSELNLRLMGHHLAALKNLNMRNILYVPTEFKAAIISAHTWFLCRPSRDHLYDLQVSFQTIGLGALSTWMQMPCTQWGVFSTPAITRWTGNGGQVDKSAQASSPNVG